jgi:MYXO-CTERM domain-containing protein
MDTAMESGQWEYGPAQTTVRLGYVLQPNGGRGGEDDSAWWTGREAGFDWLANDVDTGFTRLVSAPYDVSGLNQPKLRYYVWYQAMEFAITPPVPSTGDDLIVEASGDDGVTWVEIDRVSGQSRMWERRDAPIDGVTWVEIDRVSGQSRMWERRDAPITGVSGDLKSVRFRFTAQDGETQNLVEVGIDDVQIIAFSASCGGEGCGCKVGAADQRTPWAGIFGLAALLGASRIRRRRD